MLVEGQNLAAHLPGLVSVGGDAFGDVGRLRGGGGFVGLRVVGSAAASCKGEHHDEGEK